MNPARPPRLADRVLSRLLPAHHREVILGDLWEEYALRRKEGAGPLAQALWYWRQVLLCALTLRPRPVDRATPGRIARAGLVDLRYALRMVRRHPGYALVAILMLGLGIGGATALFSVVKTVVLDPLPFDRSEQVVAFWSGGNWSLREFEFVRQRALSLERLAAYSPPGKRLLTGRDRSEAVQVSLATAGFFRVFDASVQPGRGFLPEEELAGSAPVAVLSEGFWRRRFGGDPAIVGGSVVLDGIPHEVVGIAAPDFWFPTRSVDLWAVAKIDRGSLSYGSAYFFHVLGRLPEARGPAQAVADARVLGAALQAEFNYPQQFSKADGATVLPLRDHLVSGAAGPLLLLLCAVGCLLLIACANVAGLQINRLLSRRTELSVRLALGAGRARVVSQCLWESLVLALSGGLLGVGLAVGALRGLLAVLPPDTPRLGEVQVDLSAVLAAIGISLLTALVVGLSPGLVASNTDLHHALKQGRSTESRGSGRLRRGLVVAEYALTVVMVAAAALLARSFATLLRVDPGFATQDVVTVEVSAPADYSESARRTVFAEVLEAMRAIPSVTAAGAVQLLPLTPGWSFTLEGEGAPRVETPGAAPWRTITPGFFETLGMRMLRGRGFDRSDGAGTAPVVIINERLAETYWPGRDPIGLRLRAGMPGSAWLTVIGVVQDSRVTGLTEPIAPTFYQPYAQAPRSSSLHLVLRAHGGAAAVAPALGMAVVSVDPRLAISQPIGMERVLGETVRQPRGLMLLMGGLAGFALLLGTLGLFGVVSHIVAMRTREFGLRFTLGARTATVLALVLREGLQLAVLGIGLGLIFSFFATRVLAGSLYGVSATDPATFAAVVASLIVAALAASLLPALRASRVDPIRALQHE